MKEVILNMGSANEAVAFSRSIFKNGFVPHKAIINYDLGKGLPGEIKRLSDYPLRLEGILNGHELRVLVTPLAAGCACEGSHALYLILRFGGFSIEEKDIKTIRNVKKGKVNMTLLRK